VIAADAEIPSSSDATVDTDTDPLGVRPARLSSSTTEISTSRLKPRPVP